MGDEEREKEVNEDAGAEVEGFEPFLPVVPEELAIDPILLALLQAAAFLDLADDESVDPDQAGFVLEHVGMYVQRLGPEGAAAVQQQLTRVHAHAKSQGWPAELAEFVERFLYNCGLGDEDDAPKDEQ
jgi:hypothetical protein